MLPWWSPVASADLSENTAVSVCLVGTAPSVIIRNSANDPCLNAVAKKENVIMLVERNYFGKFM
jgi:hypothetical protein